MTLFILFSIPLTYLLVNSLFNNKNIKKRTIILPFVYGMILSIPILLLYWSFFHSFFNNWTTTGLFIYYFLNRDGLAGFYIVVLLVLYFFFFAKNIKESRLREITAYLSGLYFTIALYDALVYENWYGTLELYINPIIRIISILLIALFLNRSFKSIDWKKYLWISFSLFVPVLMVFIPVMYVSNLTLLSIIILILLFCGAIVTYFLEIYGKLKTV